MTRVRSTYLWCGICAAMGFGWAAARASAAASGEAASGVLRLVSWQYQLNGKEVPRVPTLLPYVPYLQSRDSAIVELAAMSVLCEVMGDQANRAALGFHRKATEILPFAGVPPETNDIERRIAAREKEFLGPLVDPLDAAAARGALDAYTREEMLGLENGPRTASKKYFSQMVEIQSDRYKAQLAFRRMQAKVFDRSEALARAVAGRENLAHSGVRVTLEGEKKRSVLYFRLMLRNQTGHGLRHVTLSVLTPAPRRTAEDPSFVAKAGGLLNAAAGEENLATIRANASKLQKTASDYEKAQSMPARMLFHIPFLSAGQEVKTQFQGAAFGDTPPTFSLWCDEGRWEHEPVGGLAELRVQAEQHRQEFQAQAEAARERDRGVLFGPGTGARAPRPAAGANATRMLQQAFAISVGAPMRAAPMYQAIVDRFPDSPEAQKAKKWLDGYPQLLLDRASSLSRKPSTRMQAVSHYQEVLKIKADNDKADAARAGLDDLAEAMLAEGQQYADRGENRRASATYNQLVRILPRSKAADTARARLKSLAAAGKR